MEISVRLMELINLCWEFGQITAGTDKLTEEWIDLYSYYRDWINTR